MSGCAAALFAAGFAAAAFGCTFSPYALVGSALGYGARAWLLIFCAAVLVGCVWLVLRHGETRIWFPAQAGGVLVPKDALERVAVEAVRRHPEVVAARVDLSMRRGELCSEVVVFARPLVDAERLTLEVQDAAVGALNGVVGAAPGRCTTRTRVLSVRRLKRYLS